MHRSQVERWSIFVRLDAHALCLECADDISHIPSINEFSDETPVDAMCVGGDRLKHQPPARSYRLCHARADLRRPFQFLADALKRPRGERQCVRVRTALDSE